MRMKILYIEDDRKTATLVLDRLAEYGDYETHWCSNCEEALELTTSRFWPIVLLDLEFTNRGAVAGLLQGADLLSIFHDREVTITTKVIIVTRHAELRSMLQWQRLGAHGFLTKPVNIELLSGTIRKAYEAVRLRSVAEDNGLELPPMIGRSRAIEDIRVRSMTYAEQPYPVLITGETGTGKEVLARTIHRMSSNQGGPFRAVSCASLPETLLEAELFGAVAGGYTGATRDRKGLVDEANNGTLLLDDVSDLPKTFQDKLKRLLQFGTYKPVGSSKERKSAARIIATSNRARSELLGEGVFREDFFERFPCKLEIPPLRQRPEDILLLADYFMQRTCLSRQLLPKTFTADAEQVLRTRSWPRNVRELENVVRLSVVVSADSSEITAEALEFSDGPPDVSEPSQGPLFDPAAHEAGDSLFTDQRREIENRLSREAFLWSLRKHRWSVTRAAADLGLSRENFSNSFARLFGVRPSDYRSQE